MSTIHQTQPTVTRYGPGINRVAATVESGHIVDVVGCSKSDLGRTCALHPACGLSVDVGDLLHTQYVILSKSEGMCLYVLLLYSRNYQRRESQSLCKMEAPRFEGQMRRQKDHDSSKVSKG